MFKYLKTRKYHLRGRTMSPPYPTYRVIFKIPDIFFMDNNILHTESFSLQECLIFSIRVVFSKDDLKRLWKLRYFM